MVGRTVGLGTIRMCVFFMACVTWRFGLEGEERGHRVTMDIVLSLARTRTLAIAKVAVEKIEDEWGGRQKAAPPRSVT